VIAEVSGEDRWNPVPLLPPAPNHTAYNDPARTEPRYLVSTLSDQTDCGSPEGAAMFRSMYDDRLIVTLIAVKSAAEGLEVLERASGSIGHRVSRLSLISRDYGMFDRREAPQYFEPVTLA
jgi:hypothetical protein